MQWGDGIPRDGTSRKMREYQIRFCEKLSVKFTGLTRQSLRAIGGPNRAGSHGQIFFSAPKKSTSGKGVFPVRDERSNLPAAATAEQVGAHFQSLDAERCGLGSTAFRIVQPEPAKRPRCP